MKEFHNTNKEIKLASNLENTLISMGSTQCMPRFIKRSNGITCTCSKCRYCEDDGDLYCRAWKGYRNKNGFCQLYVKKEKDENE